MPSSFETDFSSSGGALDAMYDVFGTASVYSDKVVSNQSCSVRLQRGMTRKISGKDNIVSGEIQEGKCLVRRAEIARPVIGGRFLIDGEVWTIQLSPVLKNGEYECESARVNSERRGEKRAGHNG